MTELKPLTITFLGVKLNDLTVSDCLLALEYISGEHLTSDEDYIAERRRMIERHFGAIAQKKCAA